MSITDVCYSGTSLRPIACECRWRLLGHSTISLLCFLGLVSMMPSPTRHKTTPLPTPAHLSRQQASCALRWGLKCALRSAQERRAATAAEQSLGQGMQMCVGQETEQHTYCYGDFPAHTFHAIWRTVTPQSSTMIACMGWACLYACSSEALLISQERIKIGDKEEYAQQE